MNEEMILDNETVSFSSDFTALMSCKEPFAMFITKLTKRVSRNPKKVQFHSTTIEKTSELNDINFLE